jgi:serine/threonine protein phosphatase 1
MALNLLRRFRPAVVEPPTVPAGERVYAIGDIHGRLDLFDALLDQIAADDAARGAAHTHLILLGDLIDRGAESRGVIERALQLRERHPRFHLLFGNHEEMLLAAVRSESAESMRFFIRNGGRETLLSYGITQDEYDHGSLTDLRLLANQRIPEEHLAFLESFEPSVVVGDYLFVHAGVRPGIALAEQSPSDLRWIRGEFLKSQRNHGHVVVHGHSVSEAVEEHANRIGIDTGAYATGRLTAIGLEATDRWFLSTSGAPASVNDGHDENAECVKGATSFY